MYTHLSLRLFTAWLLCSATIGGARQRLEDSHSQPILVKAVISEYPPIAGAAHVSGEVHLHLKVRKDGTVESADVVDGPAMLRAASIAGAKTALFDCTMCTDESVSYELTMRFQMTSSDPPKNCDEPIPQGFHVAVDSREHVVSVSTPEIWTCDPEMSITRHRIRGARCLYFWKCAWRSEE